MLPDYEIKRMKPKFEKVSPYIELVLILIIIQSVLSLFTIGPAEDEIRFRLLAHSNTPMDQQIKREIQLEIEPLIKNAVAISQNHKELEQNLVALEETIVEVARIHSGDVPVRLERKEALFPPKRSGLIIYPQAAYDAYILTIGSGRGDNWWCAIFPKVCFPDQEKVEEKEDEKVTFFVWEWIKGLFS